MSWGSRGGGRRGARRGGGGRIGGGRPGRGGGLLDRALRALRPLGLLSLVSLFASAPLQPLDPALAPSPQLSVFLSHRPPRDRRPRLPGSPRPACIPREPAACPSGQRMSSKTRHFRRLPAVAWTGLL